MKNKSRTSNKSLYIATALLLVVAIGIGALLIARHRNAESKEELKVTSQQSGTSLTQPQTVAVKEIAYSITIPNRNSPCSSAVYSNTKSSPRVVLPIAGFVSGIGVSVPADKIMTNLEYAIKDIDRDYKFGDYTKQERDAKVNALIDMAKKEIVDLKLDLWNQEVTRVKVEFNKTIVNGPPENCFDQLIIKKTTLDEAIVSTL